MTSEIEILFHLYYFSTDAPTFNVLLYSVKMLCFILWASDVLLILFANLYSNYLVGLHVFASRDRAEGSSIDYLLDPISVSNLLILMQLVKTNFVFLIPWIMYSLLTNRVDVCIWFQFLELKWSQEISILHFELRNLHVALIWHHDLLNVLSSIVEWLILILGHVLLAHDLLVVLNSYLILRLL